jgi:hypothetical protein
VKKSCDLFNSAETSVFPDIDNFRPESYSQTVRDEFNQKVPVFTWNWKKYGDAIESAEANIRSLLKSSVDASASAAKRDSSFERFNSDLNLIFNGLPKFVNNPPLTSEEVGVGSKATDWKDSVTYPFGIMQGTSTLLFPNTSAMLIGRTNWGSQNFIKEVGEIHQTCQINSAP